MNSKKEVLIFPLSEDNKSNARIEFRRKSFYFYSHRDNPNEKPIILKPAGIRELVNQWTNNIVAAETEENQNNDALMCMIDHMPVEKLKSNHLGCGHVVCNECWGDYVNQKIKEGAICIHSKCPVEGCGNYLGFDFVT
jgi:hypothetical protein